MSLSEGFVDIHCHLISGLDDGAESVEEALAMAKIALSESVHTIVVTPHQLGAYAHHDAQLIRDRTAQFVRILEEHDIPLRILPGADVRIEDGLIKELQSGRVLTLGDHGRHVLLELPHELFFSLESLVDSLRAMGLVGILSHPERNAGLLGRRDPIESLVEQGCLMQVTGGSLVGAFGPHCQELAEWMLERGYVHFVSTDAHGAQSRRPLMKNAFARVVELTDTETAVELCCRNPARVSRGEPVACGRFRATRMRARG